MGHVIGNHGNIFQPSNVGHVIGNHGNLYFRLQMWVMPFVLSNTLVGILMFIAACVLAVGFDIFCNGITAGNNNVKT